MMSVGGEPSHPTCGGEVCRMVRVAYRGTQQCERGRWILDAGRAKNDRERVGGNDAPCVDAKLAAAQGAAGNAIQAHSKRSGAAGFGGGVDTGRDA